MKKIIPLYIYGTIIIIAGLLLLLSNKSDFNTLKYSIGIGLTVGAVFAFLTALARMKKQVQFTYHELHALAMLIYGMSVILMCHTLENLEYFTALLLIFYSLSEIIFCFWLFNLGQNIFYKIIFVRLTLGLLTVIGTGILIYYKDVYLNMAFEGYGVLFIFIGINVLLYTPVMKKKIIDETIKS